MGNLTALFLTRFESNQIGKNSDWLTFYGAVIGGLVMLGGVQMAILDSKKNREKDKKPMLIIEPTKNGDFYVDQLDFLMISNQSIPITSKENCEHIVKIKTTFKHMITIADIRKNCNTRTLRR